MFSYLNGIRPSTRRAGSSQEPSQHQLDINGNKYEKSAHGGQRYLTSSSRSYSAFAGLNSRPTTADPPSLPPIPRVASQHGASDTIIGSVENVEGESREGDQRYDYLVSNRDDDRRSTINRSDQDVTSKRREGPPELSSSLPKTSQSLQYRWAEVVPVGHHGIQTREARSYGEPDSTLSASRRPIEVVDGRNQSSQDSLPPTRSQSQLPSNAVTTQTRHSKPKLNLLNPMSILSRRRSAQTVVQVNDNSYSATRHTSSTGSKLPDDYDPRIRGKVVHDFSAPRSRPYVDPRDRGWTERQHSPYDRSGDSGNGNGAESSEGQNRSWSQPSIQVPTGGSVQNTEKQHTPIFKEQFEEEMEPWRFDIEDRRNQHTTGLLQRMIEEEPHDRHSPLPPFARNFPSDVAKNLHMQDASFLTPKKTHPLTVSETGMTSSPHLRGVAKVIPTNTPRKGRSRATSITDPNLPGAGLPKHLKSNASRFSFDLAGVGSSAQEKLLEERHRQKNAPRRNGSMASGVSTTTNSEEGFDKDVEFMGEDEEYDGVLEERIPGVNADADDDIGYGFDVVSQATTLSLPQNIYRPNEGEVGVYGDITCYPSKLLRAPIALGILDTNKHPVPIRQAQLAADLGSGDRAASDLAPPQHSMEHSDGPSNLRPQKRVYEDDLYFDDGMIDQFDDWDRTTFDESVFDDDTSRIYGLPLRDLKPLPNIVESSSAETSEQSTRPISAESGSKAYHAHPNVESETTTNHMPQPHTVPLRKTYPLYKAFTAADFDQSVGLTSDNLAAYHSALASAADRAARDGRFDRKLSVDEGEQEAQNHGGIHKPRVSFDEQKLGHARGLPEPFVAEDDSNDFNFDDEQDDDAIIAAANAEALENDDEGFYGREFGFFAHASGSGEAQYANGGYFGPACIDGLKRSHSGKANFQEPSLTPITERSEWSQRNSMVSLPMQSLYSPSLPTPGLAQLADAMQYEDDNMSLSALLKLRRGAFGGSDASLVSSGSHKSGSPQSYMPSTPGAVLSNALSGSHLAGSSYSLVSNSEMGSETDLHPGSPTLTLQTQGLMIALPGTLQDKSSGSDSSPKRRNAVKGSGHSRSSSGTESVSYIKELDEDGADRWVLEKRRTAEGGQIEILGRQVVEGGRI